MRAKETNSNALVPQSAVPSHYPVRVQATRRHLLLASQACVDGLAILCLEVFPAKGSFAFTISHETISLAYPL